MARRRKRNSGSNGLTYGSVAFLFGIAAVYNFVVKNKDSIIFYGLIIGGILLLGLVIFGIQKYQSRQKLKKRYLNSAYYKDNLIPYHSSFETRGPQFEIEVYNTIRAAIGPNYPMLTDLLVPQMDSINMDTQIDLMVFHSSGIYVLEIKNFSGPLIGNREADEWKPFIKKSKSKKGKSFEELYELNFALYNRDTKKWVYNPIKQNEGHIKSLKQLVPTNYENVVIFSPTMFVSEAPSMITNVMSLDQFITKLKSSVPQYSIKELQDAYTKIKSFDRQNSESKKLHIARIKAFNH